MKYFIGSVLMISLIAGCEGSPKTITVTTPKTVTTKVENSKRDLMLIIHADNTLSWQPGDVKDSTLTTKISPVTAENIKVVFADYKKGLGADSGRMSVLIKSSDPNNKETFQSIVKALKESEIYKFSIVSIPVNQ
jgi:biopolymer transport protein ExbD